MRAVLVYKLGALVAHPRFGWHVCFSPMPSKPRRNGWKSQESMIAGHVTALRQLINNCKLIRKTPTIEARGAMPISNLTGMGVAIDMIIYSLTVRPRIGGTTFYPVHHGMQGVFKIHVWMGIFSPRFGGRLIILSRIWQETLMLHHFLENVVFYKMLVTCLENTYCKTAFYQKFSPETLHIVVTQALSIGGKDSTFALLHVQFCLSFFRVCTPVHRWKKVS